MCRPYGWIFGPKILYKKVLFFGRFSLKVFFYSSIKIYNEFTFNYTYLITLQHYRYDTMGSERQ